MNRTLSMLALAFMAGAISSFPLVALAGTHRPAAAVPPGWTAREGSGGSEYFLPPGATGTDVCETIFPTQRLAGSLEDTGKAIWRAAVGNERVADVTSKHITVSDGASAYRVLVATVNAQNQGVYRVFVFKQFGENVAAGEFRFDDISQIEAIGAPAIASLENMSAR